MNAYGYAIGIILGQPEGSIDYLDNYASQVFTPIESNYSATEHVALGIIYNVLNYNIIC